MALIVSGGNNVVWSPASMLFFRVSPKKKLKELSLENEDNPSNKPNTPAWYEILSFLFTFSGYV
jgi:hypothetical protein